MSKHDETFDERAARMAALAAERGDVDEKETPPAEASVVRQLPIWPDPERAAPSTVLRSALFGVVKRGERKQHKQQPLACWRGSEISYTGEQLEVRVSSPLEAYMLLTPKARYWHEVEPAIAILRQVPGFERLRLPDYAIESVCNVTFNVWAADGCPF